MTQFQPLTFPGEKYSVIAGRTAAAQRGKADVTLYPRAGDAISASIAHSRKIDATS